MSRKKPGRRRPLLILFLLLAAAVLILRFGGGGGEDGERFGLENRKPVADEKSRPAESTVPPPSPARQERQEEQQNTSAAEFWSKLFPSSTPQETPLPADPVPLDALAAWCARQSRRAGLQEEEPAAEENADLRPKEDGLSAAEGGEPAGFPGVLVFQYLPPNERDGFRALLLSFGTEPVPITGRTSREFCEKVISQLDALAGPENRGYTRFYALETGCAGPSQAEWLYENVKKRFPHILYTGQTSLNDDENIP
ncbi:MAG: hypothetical protein IJG60_05955 [Thermoguttaceae bacterium]|nr:hypothetical protein [Thermoguttaceae bacterium]